MTLNFNIRLAFILLLLVPQITQACRCIEPSIENAYNKVDLVIRATVTEVINVATGSGITAIIDVNQSWKSTTESRITVNSLTSCNYPMEKNKEYILFLTIESNGLYSTGRCYGNSELSEAKELINWLNANSPADK